MSIPNRDEALKLWHEHNHQESLLHHAYAVEAAMRYFAAKYGEDVEYWSRVGLLHDVDYEEHPDEHLKFVRPILAPAGYPDDFIRAVESHGYGLCSDVKPERQMEKVLFTVDELTGFISACALVRPSKSVLDMEVKSVKKKWKTAAFAAKIRRDIIQQGADMMGVSLDEVIADCIEALKPVAADIGLKGTL